jgi:hypothetical protein
VQSMSMSVTDARHSSASSSSSAAFRKEEGRGRERVKREERIVVVDLSENGDAITSVNCLSAGWQVLSAELSSAPTWDTAANDPTASASQHEDKGLMLRIEGLGINTQDALGLGIGEGREGNGKDCGVIGDEEMTTLLEGFDRKMGVLRKIVTQQQQQAQGQLKRESWESPGLGEKAEGEV